MFAPIWSAVQPPSVHHERWMVVYQSVPLMPSFKAQPQGSSISASKPLSTFDAGEEDEDLVARSQSVRGVQCAWRQQTVVAWGMWRLRLKACG
ncbi:hypothetical protein ES288_A06G244300v1 [Gossypium darwinii]|uniref:Uncharacterized protein n=1 Tax=Gossypium darwinii TaxID=34276 RepID=A0A5D2G9G8_GOSDA|nr:hypothetical protein ES288_A06G244300v1 [Gossypium darwinii]